METVQNITNVESIAIMFAFNRPAYYSAQLPQYSHSRWVLTVARMYNLDHSQSTVLNKFKNREEKDDLTSNG